MKWHVRNVYAAVRPGVGSAGRLMAWLLLVDVHAAANAVSAADSIVRSEPSSASVAADDENSVSGTGLLRSIQQRAFATAAAMVATEYRCRFESSTGQQSIVRFCRNGSRYRIERQDQTPAVVNGRELAAVNAVWTYDGQRYQRLKRDLERLRYSDNEQRVGATDPVVRIHAWLLQGLCEMPAWGGLQNSDLWDRRFTDAKYIGTETFDLQLCHVVEFPQRCGRVDCVYRVYFADDDFGLPLRSERIVESTGKRSTTIDVRSWQTFSAGDRDTAFPLHVVSEENGTDGLSFVQTTSWKLSPEDVDLNANLDETVFAIEAQAAYHVHDVQKNAEAIQIARRKQMQVLPESTERRVQKFLWLTLNVAVAGVLLWLVWRRRPMSES